ncbi:unnamed protein product [Rhizoctonia solani]|uniref:Uncharacterized protein n=1 Tax=Rhizoctonia solani TaxID=456999 RepID=A0A8H3GPX4_9AGAM|nr:unnamed protein product [Rhizoctonia solani]
MDRPSTKLASSHLGMPLAQYVSAYENAIMTPPDWFSDPGYERAQADIRKVSILGRDGLHDLDQISISTFRSIMHYSYSPNGYRDLGSPLLISGCIKIMSKIKESDVGSFLSYELGFTCFHIVSVGLAVCLLRGGQDLGFEIKSIVVHPELQKLYELSQRTSRIVADLASHMGGHQRDRHNCILGWSACPEHKKGSLIVSIAEAGVLLDLLYMDRHPFLEALGLTYLPGLSAVTFVLWRYVMYQRYVHPDTER